MLNFIKKEPEIITYATKNAAIIFIVAQHLVNNWDCAKKYDIPRFKITHHCNSVFVLLSLRLSLYFWVTRILQTIRIWLQSVFI